MRIGGNPAVVLHAAVLAREVVADAFAHVVLATLRKVASASAKRWLDGSVGGNPVGEGVFAVLDDAVFTAWLAGPYSEEGMIRGQVSNLRLASLIPVVTLTGLSRGHRGVVDQLQKMLSKASNDGELLAVLLKSVKLVGESCL